MKKIAICLLLILLLAPSAKAETPINLKVDFGAVGNNIDDDSVAVANWVAACVAKGGYCYAPSGHYKITSQRVLFGLQGVGTTGAIPSANVIVYGDGNNNTIFDLTGVSSSAGTPFAIYTASSLPTAVYSVFRDFQVLCNTPNVCAAMGLDNLSDNVGNMEMTNITFSNENTTSSNAAASLQLNFVFDSTFRNVVTVGKVGYGDSLRLSQAVFNNFLGGSFSNARVGVHLTTGTGSSPSGSYSNSFVAYDMENLEFGIAQDGAGDDKNDFLSGYMDLWRPDLGTPGTYCIYSSAGGELRFGTLKITSHSAPLTDPAHQVGVSFVSTSGSTSGTVSSAAMTGDGVLYNSSVLGSPITSSGTFSPTLKTQSANTFLAGPVSGSATAPTVRAIVPADVPLATSTTTGTVKPDNSTITVDSTGKLTATGGGGGGLGVLPAVRATGSTQSVASGGSPSLAQFGTVTYDNASNYTSGSSEFTAPVAGIYRVHADMTVAATASNNYASFIYKNGSSYKTVNNNFGVSNAVEPIVISDDVKLNSGDTVQIYIFQDSGSARTFSPISFSVAQVSN